MKIGFFCNEYPPRPHGGIGTFVSTLAPALARAGHEVTVVQWGNQSRTELVEGVRLVTLKENSTPRIAWLINRLRLWRWVLTEARAGRLEVFEIPDYLGCLPFPVRACPVMVRLHLAESHISKVVDGRRGRIYRLEKATLFWHRHWIGVSHYILDETQRFFFLQPAQASVIYNPVPPITPESLPTVSQKPERYVVYVGSVSERKGALLLAEAMTLVFANHPNVYVVYVGPVTHYNNAPITHQIQKILGNYAKRAIFTGRVPHKEALAWIKHAAVFVLVSKIEAMGLVLAEAMTLETPVIFADSGPGPELVTHGVDGLLVPPDSADELAKCILKLLVDPTYAKSLAEAGKRKAEIKFSLKACIEETLNFYSDALGKG